MNNVKKFMPQELPLYFISVMLYEFMVGLVYIISPHIMKIFPTMRAYSMSYAIGCAILLFLLTIPFVILPSKKLIILMMRLSISTGITATGVMMYMSTLTN